MKRGEQEKGLLWLTLIAIFLALCTAIVLMKPAQARGIPFTAKGVLYPSDVLKELAGARKALVTAARKAKTNTKLFTEYTWKLDAALKELKEALIRETEARKAGEIVGYNDLQRVKGALALAMKYGLDTAQEVHNMLRIVQALQTRVDALELNTWGFGISANGGGSLKAFLDDAIGTSIVGVGYGLLGVYGYWIKDGMLATLGLNIGIGSGSGGEIDSAIWQVLGTFEPLVYGSGSWKLGGLAMGLWDLGHGEGATEAFYGAGGLVRYMYGEELSAYLGFAIGTYGVKESAAIANVGTREPSFGLGLCFQGGINYNAF